MSPRFMGFHGTPFWAGPSSEGRKKMMGGDEHLIARAMQNSKS